MLSRKAALLPFFDADVFANSMLTGGVLFGICILKGALSKFTAKSNSILIATDVASRGLDIPHVDVVLNFDIPQHSKNYIHRVGRTARAGRAGRAITFVTQYDVELYQRIEELLGKKLELHPCEESEVRPCVSGVARECAVCSVQCAVCSAQ